VRPRALQTLLEPHWRNALELLFAEVNLEACGFQGCDAQYRLNGVWAKYDRDPTVWSNSSISPVVMSSSTSEPSAAKGGDINGAGVRSGSDRSGERNRACLVDDHQSSVVLRSNV